jgi:CubicO group peptidase (beta-lactamase class C family)
LLIEQASGLPYRDYVRRNIFAPAGMANSDFFRMDRVQERVAEGTDPIHDEAGRITGWKRNIYSMPPLGSPDGGAHVTAQDLDHFLRAVKMGELLSRDSTAAFFRPQVHHGPMDGGTRKYGFGWWFCVDEAGQVLFGEKEGCVTGVSGLIRHYFDTDINVVILSNMEQGAWEPIRKIHRVISVRALV